MPRETLTLGLLPERKRNWRTFVISYTGCAIIVMMLLCIHLIWPDRMSTWAKYTVTEIIPLPDLVPENPIIKPKPRITNLLPEAKFETPKLIVPREMPKPRIEEARVEPPRIQQVNFEAPKLQPVSGAMPANVIHTGQFGSSATPTVNARFRRCRPEASAIPTAFPVRVSKGLSWLPLSSAHSIFRKAQEPVTALAGPKESKAQLRVPGSVMVLPNRGTAMGEQTARACRLPGSKRSK